MRSLSKILVVCMAALFFSPASYAYEVEVAGVYVEDISVYYEWNDVHPTKLQGVVHFTVKDPSPDLCLRPWFDFYFKLGIAGANGVETPTSYGRSYLAMLLLANMHDKPLRVVYETDAASVYPLRKESCDNNRHVPEIKWLGLDYDSGVL